MRQSISLVRGWALPSQGRGADGGVRGVVDFGVEARGLVAGCELGCGEAVALGVELAHGVLFVTC